MVDQAAALDGTAIGQGLLQRIQDEGCVGRAADAPADDASGIGVDDEGNIDEALPGRDVGEVRQPQRVRARCVELPVYPVERTGCCRIADSRADLAAAHDALQAHPAHQAGHRGSDDFLFVPPKLAPHLAHAVDAEVHVEHTLYQRP